MKNENITRSCSDCKYLCYPEYESSYTECQVFGEEPPDQYWVENGCNCSDEKLEEIMKRNEELLEKDHEAFVEWFLEKEKDG